MPFSDAKKNRALLIGRSVQHDELRLVLNGYGYFVEHTRTRLDGVHKFRAHRPALVIVDAEAISGYPERFFRFFRLVRENAIVLVAAGGTNQSQACRYLLWGAHDILQLPLRREALNFTLSRTSAYHRSLVRSTYLKHAAWFGLAMVPLWTALILIALR